MYRAGATTDSRGGSQIWIAHRLARLVASQKAFSPWILRVVLAVGVVQVHLISAHAPFETNSEENRETRRICWSMFAGVLAEARLQKHIYVILGLDANAHVGSVESVALGCCQPQAENENGEALRVTAEIAGLNIVNIAFDAGAIWADAFGN